MDVTLNKQSTITTTNLTIDVDLPYSDFKVFKFPESCTRCPVGFMDCGCGRNTPLLLDDYETRPETCKLQLIDDTELLQIVKKVLEGNINGSTISVATEI